MEIMGTATTLKPDLLLERVYEAGFYNVARYISRHGGSIDDAKDVFHDALIVLYKETLSGKKIDSEVAYLVGVSKNIWSARLRKDLKTTSLHEETDRPDPEICTANQRKLLDVLRDAGSRCMDLLVAFYYEKASMKDLAMRFGFASEHSGSVQKYKCIEKVRETIRSKAIAYEDFFE